MERMRTMAMEWTIPEMSSCSVSVEFDDMHAASLCCHVRQQRQEPGGPIPPGAKPARAAASRISNAAEPAAEPAAERAAKRKPVSPHALAFRGRSSSGGKGEGRREKREDTRNRKSKPETRKTQGTHPPRPVHAPHRGCPQWGASRVGTPAPGRPSGSPTQAAEQAASSKQQQQQLRGDAKQQAGQQPRGARAAERARTGGAKTAPCRGHKLAGDPAAAAGLSGCLAWLARGRPGAGAIWRPRVSQC
jgi:hypothetical protein